MSDPTPPLQTLVLSRPRPGVAQVTMAREAVFNAFDETMIAELDAAFTQLANDDAVRVIVLAGAGRHFSAGADLQWMQRASTASIEWNVADARRFAGMLARIAACPKPTVARVQGAALGGGVGLTCACDIAIAADNAAFAVSEAKFGILPAVIGPYVTNAVGKRHALRLARQGVRVTAIDQSPEMLAAAREAAGRAGLPLELHTGSLDDPLPFADGQFDLVICGLALCHVQNLRGAVGEFARVLRPGGTAIITDFHPYCVGQGWRAAVFGPGRAYVLTYPGHTRADYLAALDEAGLQLTQAVDATMGEAPVGTMLDEEREGGKDVPFCLILQAVKPAAPGGPSE